MESLFKNPFVGKAVLPNSRFRMSNVLAFESFSKFRSFSTLQQYIPKVIPVRPTGG